MQNDHNVLVFREVNQDSFKAPFVVTVEAHVRGLDPPPSTPHSRLDATLDDDEKGKQKLNGEFLDLDRLL